MTAQTAAKPELHTSRRRSRRAPSEQHIEKAKRAFLATIPVLPVDPEFREVLKREIDELWDRQYWSPQAAEARLITNASLRASRRQRAETALPSSSGR